MKNFKLIIILLIGSFLFSNASCQQANKKEQAGIHWLEYTDFKMKVDEKAGVLIDVRTPEEYADGHIPGSKNINFHDDNFQEEIAKLNRETPYLLYCRTANRSGSAASIMHDMGFKDVSVLQGGVTKWKEKGADLEQ